MSAVGVGHACKPTKDARRRNAQRRRRAHSSNTNCTLWSVCFPRSSVFNNGPIFVPIQVSKNPSHSARPGSWVLPLDFRQRLLCSPCVLLLPPSQLAPQPFPLGLPESTLPTSYPCWFVLDENTTTVVDVTTVDTLPLSTCPSGRLVPVHLVPGVAVVEELVSVDST